MEIDARDRVRQVPIQLRSELAATEKCKRQVCDPFIHFRMQRSESIRCLRAVVDGQHSAADVQIEDVLLPAHAERGVFDGGDQESSLGPLALDGFGGDTGCRRDFRQGGACVPLGGEQLRRGCDDPRPRLLRLLLT